MKIYSPNRYLKRIRTPLICLLLGLGLIALGATFKLGAGDWGTWTGGIGTVATLFYAIRIAHTDERRRLSEDLDHARVVAAEFWLTLPSIRSTIRRVDVLLENALNANVETGLRQCQSLLDSIPAWETGKLARLICLEGHVAAKLAMASTEIRMCAQQLRTVLSPVCVAGDDDWHRELLDVALSIECIEGYLEDAFKQCDTLLGGHVV